MKQKLQAALQKILVSPGWVLLIIILFSAAYFIFAHEGFYWIDDYGYAHYAWEISKGTFSVFQNSAVHPNNPLTHRVMVFAPVAVFYKLFGINIYSTTLWPFLCTIGCSGIIYLLFRKENPGAAVAGMVLLGLYFHSLFLATYLYPDNILMFFAFAAAAVLYRFRFQAGGAKPFLYALLFSLANFAAFLSKETLVYFLPFYFWLFALDIFRKQHLRFWLYTILFGSILLGIYFGFYHYHTGDWLYRFHVIEQTNAAYHEGEPVSELNLPARLTYVPILFFIGTGIMVVFGLALGMFRNFNLRRFAALKQREYFWLILALLVTLQFWFGSTSLTFYTPISLVPRMCSILMPPLCIAGAFGLQNFWKNDRLLAGIFALIFFAVGFFDSSSTAIMYLLLFAYFAWHWGQMRRPDFRISVPLCIGYLIVVLSLRPLHFMRKPSLMAFREQNRLIKENLNGNDGKNLVLGDRWLDFMHDFHYQFEQNPHYTFRQFKAQENFSNYDHVYLLLNRRSLSNPDMAKWQTVQEPELNQLYPNKELVAQQGEVLLFRLK